MKIIHLILLGLVGSTRAKETGSTADDDLYAIIEEVVYQKITQIIEQKTTTIVSGPSVDGKKPGTPNEIWNLNGYYKAEGVKGDVTMKIKFVDCWDGAFTGSAVVEGWENENVTAQGTWYKNGELVFVMSYAGVLEGISFLT